MEQKTFSRSGLAVFSSNPLRLGRGGSQNGHSKQVSCYITDKPCYHLGLCPIIKEDKCTTPIRLRLRPMSRSLSEKTIKRQTASSRLFSIAPNNSMRYQSICSPPCRQSWTISPKTAISVWSSSRRLARHFVQVTI